MGWTSPLECTQEHGICLSFYYPILSRQCKRHPSLLYCYSFLRRNIQLSDMNPGPRGHTCTWDRTSVCMHRSAGVLLAGQADADCMKRLGTFQSPWPCKALSSCSLLKPRIPCIPQPASGNKHSRQCWEPNTTMFMVFSKNKHSMLPFRTFCIPKQVWWLIIYY